MIIVTNPILTRVDSLNKSVSAALNPIVDFIRPQRSYRPLLGAVCEQAHVNLAISVLRDQRGIEIDRSEVLLIDRLAHLYTCMV
jgi:hypothetical protein